MSAVVKTVTPFFDKECLLQALDKLDICHTSTRNSIKLKDNEFIYRNGHYTLNIYSYNYRAIKWNEYKKNTFLEDIEKHYNDFYTLKINELERKKQEELAVQELKRIKDEKRAFVEKQKNEIITKAKTKGYSVKEKMVNNKVKLILVRHIY